MKTLLSALTFCFLAGAACAQGTLVTYQGRLSNNGSATDGLYDFTFQVYDAASSGNPVGPSVATNAVAVSSGLFTANLDFGAGVFTGPPRWLQIAVKSNSPAGSPMALSPRQQLTTTPYAMTSGNLTGTLPASQLSGTVPSALLSGTYSQALTLNNSGNGFTGNGSGLTSLNANNLASGTISDARLAANIPRVNQVWLLGGNGGTIPGQFIGASDNQPLELRVNGARVLRLEPTVAGPNLVAGFQGNSVSPGVTSATIAGGGQIGGTNRVNAAGGTVGGGVNNTVTLWNGTVSGGVNNTAAENASTVSGGSENVASGHHAVIGVGQNNTASYAFATVGGGQHNKASLRSATVGGGEYNTASFDFATVGGGQGNTASLDSSTVGGGWVNTAAATSATVAGGENNTASGRGATVAGGYANQATNYCATVPGGANNLAGGSFSFAAGRRAKVNHAGCFIWADSQDTDFVTGVENQFAIRASGGAAFLTYDSAFQVQGSALISKNATSFTGARQLAISHTGNSNWGLNLGYYFNPGVQAAGVIQALDGGNPTQLEINPSGGRVLLGNGDVAFGNYRFSRLSADQGGSIEIGDSDALSSTPFIDFHYGVNNAQDYNVRLIKDGDNRLTCFGNFQLR